MAEVIDTGKPKNNLKEFDRGALWEKHEYVDLAAGSVTMLVPVTVGRVRDDSRSVKFFSSVTALRGRQQVQLAFEIEGVVTLEEALGKWMECANAQAAEFHRKSEEEEIRSRLAVPAGARMTQMN